MRGAIKLKTVPALIIATLLVGALAVFLPGCRGPTVGPGENKSLKQVAIPIPVGAYVRAKASSPCGFLTEEKLSPVDDAAVFDNPQHYLAQLIWFGGTGFLEYEIANPLPEDAQVKTLRLFFEACAEAPSHDPNQVTDLSIYINGKKIGTHTIKGDFGGKRGKYPLPSWWPINNTQYGQPIFVEVRGDGTYIADRYSEDWAETKKADLNFKKVSTVRVSDLELNQPSLVLRIGVDPEAAHRGGMNLFGEKFGNYPKTLTLGLEYAGEKIYQPRIAQVIDNPAAFADKTVLLTGHPGGWGCPSGKSTPLPEAEGFSRSSTTIYDDTGCLYHRGEVLVAGKVVSELHPLYLPGKETIVVLGKIRLDKHGVPYLSGVPYRSGGGGEASGGGQSGYTLKVHREYPYGPKPEDMGIERGAPPVSCGGFSPGGAEGDLYVLDLVHRNIKVLRGTDGNLRKVISAAAVLSDSGYPGVVDIAVDNSGVIYLLVAASGRTRVVALDDTGRVLAEYPIPEEVVSAEWSQLMRTGEGKVVLGVASSLEHRWYSFKERRFTGRGYEVTINDEHDLMEIVRSDNGSQGPAGSYREKYIAAAAFCGEDQHGNFYVWIQTGKVPPAAEDAGKNIRLKVLRFSSKEGKLLDTLLVPHDDYFAMYHPKFFTVDQAGNIYQVLPAEDRLEVNIWSPQAR